MIFLKLGFNSNPGEKLEALGFVDWYFKLYQCNYKFYRKFDFQINFIAIGSHIMGF